MTGVNRNENRTRIKRESTENRRATGVNRPTIGENQERPGVNRSENRERLGVNRSFETRIEERESKRLGGESRATRGQSCFGVDIDSSVEYRT